MIAMTRTARTGPTNSGNNWQRAIPTIRKETANMEFSKALLKDFLVRTACQEKHSATSIDGTISHAAHKVIPAPVIVASWCRIIAHCTAKQISATVATDRPTITLDSHVSNKQIRWTSARGRNDLNAQPKTYAAERKSITSTPNVLPRLLVCGP